MSQILDKLINTPNTYVLSKKISFQKTNTKMRTKNFYMRSVDKYCGHTRKYAHASQMNPDISAPCKVIINHCRA